jgi:hypothetical protein
MRNEFGDIIDSPDDPVVTVDNESNAASRKGRDRG